MTHHEGRALRYLRTIGTALARLPRPSGLLFAVGWAFVIWNVSSIEGVAAPQNFVRSWLHNSAHAPFFGLLAFLLCIALPRKTAVFGSPERSGPWPRLDLKGTLLVLGLVLAYAMTDEWHQGHVPGRDPDWLDIVTDMTGAVVTLWMITWLGRPTAQRGGLWPRIGLGLALCLAAGFTAAWRSWQ